MADLSSILRNMPSNVRTLVERQVELYEKTGDRSYAEQILEIISAYDDDPAVRELERVLRRQL